VTTTVPPVRGFGEVKLARIPVCVRAAINFVLYTGNAESTDRAI
jgi:hypothetical protein